MPEVSEGEGKWLRTVFFDDENINYTSLHHLSRTLKVYSCVELGQARVHKHHRSSHVIFWLKSQKWTGEFLSHPSHPNKRPPGGVSLIQWWSPGEQALPSVNSDAREFSYLVAVSSWWQRMVQPEEKVLSRTYQRNIPRALYHNMEVYV